MGARSGKSGNGAGKPAPSTLSVTEQRAAGHEAALRLITSRERSAAELRERLRLKGFDREVVEAIIDRLQETGLQDDTRFAERFAAEATGARSMASHRVRGELMRKGIDRELAAVAATQDPDQEEARARALANQRAARMNGLSPEVRVRRLMGLLARRGYDADVCRRVAAEAGGAEEPRD